MHTNNSLLLRESQTKKITLKLIYMERKFHRVVTSAFCIVKTSLGEGHLENQIPRVNYVFGLPKQWIDEDLPKRYFETFLLSHSRHLEDWNLFDFGESFFGVQIGFPRRGSFIFSLSMRLENSSIYKFSPAQIAYRAFSYKRSIETSPFQTCVGLSPAFPDNHTARSIVGRFV